MIHPTPSPLAGKTVRIKAHVLHPQVPGFGGSLYRIEDWWDRVSGMTWGFAKGNPACLIYALRIGTSNIAHPETAVPADDEVLYGKVGPLGHLVHINEIENE